MPFHHIEFTPDAIANTLVTSCVISCLLFDLPICSIAILLMQIQRFIIKTGVHEESTLIFDISNILIYWATLLIFYDIMFHVLELASIICRHWGARILPRARARSAFFALLRPRLNF